MEKYRIAYIDERSEERDDFERYIDDDFFVELIEPTVCLDEVIDNIIANNYDAIISDYNLSEYNPTIKYDGIDIVNKIQNIKCGFPCFVLTSYDEDAAQQADDVNLVYVKNVLTDSNGILSFKERVRIQIKHYRKKIESAKTEHAELSEKNRVNRLNVDEEQRLIFLDNFLESSINNNTSTPVAFKESHNAEKLSELIDSTKELLKFLEAK